MKVRPTLLALSLLSLVALMTPLAAERTQPFLMELPLDLLATGVGASGGVVVATDFNGGGLAWLPTTGTSAIGGTQAVAVSRDGQTIVGDVLDSQGNEQAAIRTIGNWRLLGGLTPSAQPCDRLLSGAYGTDDEGKVVVGLAWDGCRIARAFRWEESTGMVNLGSTTANSSRANNVSGDGQVVIGWQETAVGFRQGARWVHGAQELFRGPNGIVGEAHAANHDGSLIVGGDCAPDVATALPSAWTWTAALGVRCFPVERPRSLPPLPYSAVMLTTSENGSVIGGAFTFGLDSEALIWLDGQVFFLKDYLQQNGLPDAFRNWVNTGFVQAVTPDGRTLVGYGAGPLGFQGYLVVLPDRGKR